MVISMDWIQILWNQPQSLPAGSSTKYYMYITVGLSQCILASSDERKLVSAAS